MYSLWMKITIEKGLLEVGFVSRSKSIGIDKEIISLPH
jgi:hypothetical protein